MDKDIIRLEQKFKRLAEQARQQRVKGEGEQNQGEYSLPDDIDFEKIREAQLEVNRLTDEIRKIESSDDFKKQMDLLSEAIDNDDIANGIKVYEQWKKDSGYAEMVNKRDTLRSEIEQWQKGFKESYANNEIKKEKEAIEKSGLSESEYFQGQAVKEFGYTPYFYDAGYILPNGRMLNFSGEKNKHFGSRGQDHRAIGTIYANTQGSEAMVRFMSDGNIRIMAESPGIDLGTETEPTTSQYNTISRFIRESAKNKYFFVDFTDSKGNVIGSLEYDGILNTDEILYDIKDYFKNGTIRNQSKEYGQYSLPSIDRYTEKQYNNFGWVATSGILSGKELKQLYSQFANIKLLGHKYPKTKQGENIIITGKKYGDIDNIVFIKGTNKHPIVTKIYSFIGLNQQDREISANEVAEYEQSGYDNANEIVEAYAGHSVFRRYTLQDCISYSEYKKQRHKLSGDENSKKRNFRAGSNDENISTLADSIDGSVYSLPESDAQYSLPEIDNEGNKLSEGQRRFFDKSKLTDEQGNLLRLYHGSRNGGFTKFSAKYSDDGITLFLTPSRELAGTYTDSMDTIKLPEGKKGLARMFEKEKPLFLAVPLMVEQQYPKTNYLVEPLILD